MPRNKNEQEEVKVNNKSDNNDQFLTGMYKEYFLDYASYVILERAVPSINDGLKPVQRRILHSMKQMDDGRYHKVANIIGQTMQYHPHGDSAIGDALVNLGQKNLLIDCQGNWGDIRTGDRAAASRYIEARLTKFALEVAFNPQTTEWQLSYDGRKKEPIDLPVKFPLVLAQGVEGIAVGLSTKIMPHNFIELVKASIKILNDKKVKVYPDFQMGGFVDVSEYNDGKRGGKIKVRARITQRDKSTLVISELPYGVTTNSLIESVIKAGDKGQIKFKKIVDNTAKVVEVVIELPSGVSPDMTIDALYAFTRCEESISPNACVIVDNKPQFLCVGEILKISTDKTKELLKLELEIKKGELLEKWHLSSLEKIFIEKRIYRDIEECETWESVLEMIDKGLKKYVITLADKATKSDKRLRLMRNITEEDLIKLTEIKIKRISKYNSFKADELIIRIEEELKQVNYDLEHLTEYSIAYFEHLLVKYGKGRERRTEISSFETIKVRKVVANNARLYVNRKDGFVGTGLRRDEFIQECSDIDDIIAFTKEGNFKVVKVSDKVFIGKNILHTAVWKKGDDRTVYNLIYLDGKTGRAMAKRFSVTGVTRDRYYPMSKGHKGSKVLYFTANPNGESEIVQIQLSPGCKAKKKLIEFDFHSIDIKGRGSGGNIVTKYPVRKITQLEQGKSSLGAQRVWIDEVSGRLNKDERGKFLGNFDTGDQVIALYKDGTYELNDLDLHKKYDAGTLEDILVYKKDQVISCLYFEGEKSWTMVKRFIIDTSKNDTRYKFISENGSSKLYFASLKEKPVVEYNIKVGGKKQVKVLDFVEFVDVKGWKAFGNKLGEFKILKVIPIDDGTPQPELFKEKKKKVSPSAKKTRSRATSKKDNSPPPSTKTTKKKSGKVNPGDTIEFDF